MLKKSTNDFGYCIKKNKCFDDTKKTLDKLKKFHNRLSLSKNRKITIKDVEKFTTLYKNLKKDFFKKKVINCIKNNCLDSVVIFINNYKLIVPFFQKMYKFSIVFKNTKDPYVYMLLEVSTSILDFYENLIYYYN